MSGFYGHRERFTPFNASGVRDFGTPGAVEVYKRAKTLVDPGEIDLVFGPD